MNRRRADTIQHKIDAWEQLRDQLGGTATHAVVGYISAMVDRLRLAKLTCSRPRPGGRRVDDPQPRPFLDIKRR